jgi:hypothetical protein
MLRAHLLDDVIREAPSREWRDIDWDAGAIRVEAPTSAA